MKKKTCVAWRDARHRIAQCADFFTLARFFVSAKSVERNWSFWFWYWNAFDLNLIINLLAASRPSSSCSKLIIQPDGKINKQIFERVNQHLLTSLKQKSKKGWWQTKKIIWGGSSVGLIGESDDLRKRHLWRILGHRESVFTINCHLCVDYNFTIFTQVSPSLLD